MISERDFWETMRPVKIEPVEAADVDGDYLHGLWPVDCDGAWRVIGPGDLLSRRCLDCGARVDRVRCLAIDGSRFYYGWNNNSLHWMGER